MADNANAAASVRARIRSSRFSLSWPGIAVRRTASLRSPMSWPSTSWWQRMEDVDARDKPGHDDSSFPLQPDLAQIDALAEPRLDDLLRPPRSLDLDRVGAGILVEP